MKHCPIISASSTFILFPQVSTFGAIPLAVDILYPFPFISLFTHFIQKWMNTHHFIGPPPFCWCPAAGWPVAVYLVDFCCEGCECVYEWSYCIGNLFLEGSFLLGFWGILS